MKKLSLLLVLLLTPILAFGQGYGQPFVYSSGGGGSGTATGINAATCTGSVAGKILFMNGTVIDCSTGVGISSLNSSSSANLAAVLSDETGSGGGGLSVFNQSPVIVTPTIASFVNATHDHANAAGGGNIPESSVTSLVSDLAAKSASFTTSAGLAALLSDETGSSGGGLLVFNQSPTIVTPTIASFVNANHNHTNSAGGGTLAEGALALTDVTTNNSSTSNHGFLKKLSNVSTEFMNGQGNWATPAAGMSGSGTTNQFPKFTGATSLGDSTLTDNTTSVVTGSSAGSGHKLANASATGTTANKLVKQGSTGGVIVSAADTGGVLGICDAGCGTTGEASIITSGPGSCVFDNAVVKGDFFGKSTSVDGDCTDIGTSLTGGVPILGTVTNANAAAGTRTVWMNGPDVANVTNVKGGGGGGGLPAGAAGTIQIAASGNKFGASNFSASAAILSASNAQFASSSGPTQIGIPSGGTPVILDRTTGSTDDATAVNVTVPTVFNPNELFFLIITGGSSGTPTLSGIPVGWVTLVNAQQAFNGNRIWVYYKVTSGSEVNFTLTASQNVRMSNVLYRISNSDLTTPPEAASISSGSSSAPDPPSITPSWGSANNLWVAVAWTGGGCPVSGYPSGYSNTFAQTVHGDTDIGIASRTATASSENPSAFATTGSCSWGAETLAIKPAGAGSTQTGWQVTTAGTWSQMATQNGFNLIGAVSGSDIQVTARGIDTDVNMAVTGKGAGGVRVGATDATPIKKHLSATATLDFANQVAAGCEELSVTVTGAAAGDTCELGVPNGSNTTNSSFTCRVSTTNTAQVKHCAVVSGDPASGSFRVDVWKH